MLHRNLLALSLLAALACDSKTDAPPAKAAAATKPADAKKADDKKADAKANPHGDAKAAHGGNPHGAAAGPHGGKPPMMAPKKPKGPPRDITPSGEVTAETLKAMLAVSVPKEWEKGTPSSGMRAAQWVLPGPGGDAELVIYYAPGGMGDAAQNIARWKGQFQPPEGKTLDDITKTETKKAGGLEVTSVDVTGRFVAAVMPGADEKHDEANYRMLAAIVEGTKDPFYFKAVGPQKTMDLWADAFAKMLGDVKKSEG